VWRLVWRKGHVKRYRCAIAQSTALAVFPSPHQPTRTTTLSRRVARCGSQPGDGFASSNLALRVGDNCGTIHMIFHQIDG
jgi:hypothetical protein